MYIAGSTLIIGAGIEAKKDAWLAILIAAAAAFPVLMAYSRILSRFPGMDLFDILETVFGKVAGKIISVFFIWYAFHLGTLVVRNFGEFIHTVGLPATPMPVPMGFIVILCLWIVREGLEVLGRWADIFIYVIYLIIISTMLLSLPDINPDNLRPVLYKGMQPVIEGALGIFSFPFAETVVFMMVLPSQKPQISAYRVYGQGLLIGMVLMLIVSFRNITVLGPDLMLNVYFPSYVAVRIINIGDFLQRIEITIAVGLLIGGFIKISICLLAACKGLAKLFGREDYRFIVTPIALLMLYMSILIYDNIFEMFDFIKIWFYYSFPFQVILPLVILVFAEIKSGKNAKKVIF